MLKYSWNVHYEFWLLFVSVRMWPEKSWSKFFIIQRAQGEGHKTCKIKLDTFPITVFKKSVILGLKSATSTNRQIKYTEGEDTAS